MIGLTLIEQREKEKREFVPREERLAILRNALDNAFVLDSPGNILYRDRRDFYLTPTNWMKQ